LLAKSEVNLPGVSFGEYDPENLINKNDISSYKKEGGIKIIF
jgi:hypothetical protein